MPIRSPTAASFLSPTARHTYIIRYKRTTWIIDPSIFIDLVGEVHLFFSPISTGVDQSPKFLLEAV